MNIMSVHSSMRYTNGARAFNDTFLSDTFLFHLFLVSLVYETSHHYFYSCTSRSWYDCHIFITSIRRTL